MDDLLLHRRFFIRNNLFLLNISVQRVFSAKVFHQGKLFLYIYKKIYKYILCVSLNICVQRVFSATAPHGAGGGVVLCWQKTPGGYLATAGHDHIVNVFDRHGHIAERINMPGWACAFKKKTRLITKFSNLHYSVGEFFFSNFFKLTRGSTCLGELAVTWRKKISQKNNVTWKILW